MVDKKEKDEVTLPGAVEEEPEEEKVGEPKNVDPSEEDTVELPDDDENPKSENAPEESMNTTEEGSKLSLGTHAVEYLKIFHSRDMSEVESRYTAWYREFIGVDNPGHIIERHLLEGGNGLIYLCVFYTVFESVK